MAKDKKPSATQETTTEAPATAAPTEDTSRSIDLVRLEGVNNDPDLGEQRVLFDQYVIRLSTPGIRKRGRPFLEIGYVGMQAGAPINWLPTANSIPRDEHRAIEQAIQAKLASLPGAHESDKQLAEAGETRRVGRAPSEEVMNAEPPQGMGTSGDTAGSDENL